MSTQFHANFSVTMSATLAVGAVYNPASGQRLVDIEHFKFGPTGTMSDAAVRLQLQRSTTAPTGGGAIVPVPSNPASQAALILAMNGTSITNGTLTANAFLYDEGIHVRNFLNLPIRGDRCWQIPATAAAGVHIMTPSGPLVTAVSTLSFTE